MGAKDTMSTFFKAMRGQSISTSGYGPKIVSTPMGPFSWNDHLQTWVNTNNGMQMANIAFQDMYAMMDYGVSDGAEPTVATSAATPTINTLTFSPTSQNIDNATGDNALTPTFTISGNTTPVALKWNLLTGSIGVTVIKYKKNGGILTTWAQNTSTGAVTFASGDTLQIFGDATAETTPSSATFRLFNVTDSNAACSNTLSLTIVINA